MLGSRIGVRARIDEHGGAADRRERDSDRGRWTSGSLRISSRPAASMAPVFPAEITA
jgi:hypothetical protein